MWLKTLISSVRLPAELDRRCKLASRAAFVIAKMRRERTYHNIADLPLDRYLRGLAELAGVALTEVQSAFSLPALDSVTAVTAPILARIARLVGIPGADTEMYARWTFLQGVDSDRSDAILALSRGPDAKVPLDIALQTQESAYSADQAAELARVIKAIRHEYSREA
jgi:hypothetical protein